MTSVNDISVSNFSFFTPKKKLLIINGLRIKSVKKTLGEKYLCLKGSGGAKHFRTELTENILAPEGQNIYN